MDSLINKSNSASDIKNSYSSVINSPGKNNNYLKIKLPKLNLHNKYKMRNQRELFKNKIPINFHSSKISNSNSKDDILTKGNNLHMINFISPNLRSKSISTNIKRRRVLSNISIKKNNSLCMNNIDSYIPKYKNKNIFLKRNFSTKNKNFNIKLDNINLRSSKLSPKINFEFAFPKNIKNPINFHQELMVKNIESFNKSKLNDYKKIIEKKNKTIEEKLNEQVTTGIYGPKNNVLSIILARMERLKINHEFKEMVSDPEIQKILQDEFMLAQVRLNRKPKKIIIGKNNEIKSLCMRKMEKYNYLSSQNKIMYVNPIGNLPKMIEDNKIMYKYFDDAYKFFKDKKHKINLKSV